ncbi:long-chain fatty acid--CoA ligase [Marinobacter nauticus]|uniref:long-chain fatty acid--CoA ligase n=1 Tax=Marinobacter nauticus TaxID=2743 RepID=UPI0040447CB3
MIPMQDAPLSITNIMRHAERYFGDQEIVSIAPDNPRHRYTYRDAFRRVRQLANALDRLGIHSGDVIGTLAWNDYRHLELYYAISCSGMVCHTINPRLFSEQIEYIINHAEDRWLFVDPDFIPLIEKLAPRLTHLNGIVVLCPGAAMPVTSLSNVLCYEALLEAERDEFDWPELPETTPSALCYTSGTTGNPKGVLYTHRSTILQCYATTAPNAFGVSSQDVVLPIVPMFHANGWSLVYSSPMNGAKLVLAGNKAGDGAELSDLINSESVTFTAGVPTVLSALLRYLREHKITVPSLIRVGVGGAACSKNIYEEFESLHDVRVEQGWGMTELNPIATYNGIEKPSLSHLSGAELTSKKLKQGPALFGVDIKIVDDHEREVPWDGKSSGAVKVRGPWVIHQYFRQEQPAVDNSGWFDTGDIGTIDPDGYLQITDRSKDVIKSGGEWISSIELENLAVSHPDIVEAAVIGLPHPKWTERPLLLLVVRDDSQLTPQAMLSWFEDKVAKWWVPSDCVIVDQLPHTATGKLSKKDLRDRFKDFTWQE